jgi:hypothetical protein
MKNVFKAFWRKPREDNGQPLSKGEVRYRYDRIETQTLMLADLAFTRSDYDNAYQMYKLVKDEYKSDKSYIHYAHTNLMMAVSLLKIETIMNLELYFFNQMMHLEHEFTSRSAYAKKSFKLHER